MDLIPEDSSRIRELEVEILHQLEQQAASMSIEELTDCALQALADLQAELGEPYAAESPASLEASN